ncbi:TBCC domain-containing protein 1 [Boothiomyces sp. JEL0838]|nr:TBCC domain-containing protein 1 [Boothiomyces sp. JEL0838]
MTLYLNENLHDFSQLIIPDDTHFNYTNLLALCTDLTGKQTIGLNLWTELASSHFKLAPQDSRIFFETFSLSFAEQKGSMMSVPVLTFVLFLYNQLYGLSISQIPVKTQDEYPNLKEGPHFPLENTELPTHASCASLDEVDIETLNHQSFPSHLIDGRNKLTTYWRSTTKKWLQLIYVVVYGNKADARHNSSRPNGFDFNIKDLAGMDAFFTAVLPASRSQSSKINHERFQSWMNQREFAITFNYPKDLHAVSDNTLRRADVCSLLNEYFQYSTFSNCKVPLDALNYCFQWCIMEGQPNYSTIKLSENGVALETESNRQVSFANPEVLLSRKKHLSIMLSSEFIENKKVILHRLYDCNIYLVGLAKNVMISRCKNTNIYAGVLHNQVHLQSSVNCRIHAICKRIMVSMDASAITSNIDSNHLFVNTKFNPLLSCSATNNIPVVLAPFDNWHFGILDQIKLTGNDLKVNLWNQPVSVQRNSTDYSILAPSQFFLSELPFTVLPNPANTVNEGKPETTVEYQTILKHLPLQYATWLEGMSKINNLLIEAIKKATLMDPTLSTTVEDEFQKWLTTSGNIKYVGSMLGLQSDYEKLIK